MRHLIERKFYGVLFGLLRAGTSSEDGTPGKRGKAYQHGEKAKKSFFHVVVLYSFLLWYVEEGVMC